MGLAFPPSHFFLVVGTLSQARSVSLPAALEEGESRKAGWPRQVSLTRGRPLWQAPAASVVARGFLYGLPAAVSIRTTPVHRKTKVHGRIRRVLGAKMAQEGWG